MKKLKFHTNINCGGCIEKIKPYLDGHSEVKDWNVDTSDSDKTLTIKTSSLTEKDVESLVRKAGFEARAIKEGLFSKFFGK